MKSNLYSNLTEESVEKVITAYFSTRSKQDIEVKEHNSEYYKIAGKGIFGYVRKDMWDKAVKKASS